MWQGKRRAARLGGRMRSHVGLLITLLETACTPIHAPPSAAAGSGDAGNLQPLPDPGSGSTANAVATGAGGEGVPSSSDTGASAIGVAGQSAAGVTGGSGASVSGGGPGGSGTNVGAAGMNGGSAAPSTPPAPGCMPVAEVCDGLDNDCDGLVDEQVKKRCWADLDGDGTAAAGAAVIETCDECGAQQTAKEPLGAAIDCDDTDKTKSPDATDICGDNIDNDCDGTPDNKANNACDGPCTVQLPGKPGDACSNGLKGACARMGRYDCQPDHTLACTAPAVTGTPEKCGDNSDNDCDGVVDNGCVMNACGGWTKLSPDKGTSCSMGSGSCRGDGQYVCDGADKTVCNARAKDPNGCGGCAPLSNLGRSCTADCTSGGQYVCDGADATRCSVTAKRRNSCGGCSTLAHDMNASCSGECGQTAHYKCDGTDATVCKNDGTITRNTCGGCSAISSSETPGTYCSKGMNSCAAIGTFACTGSGDSAKTACNAQPNVPSNGCGGCVPPNKGESCVVNGFDGVYECDPVQPELTYCVQRM
jgi:hypothetical protein